MYPEGDEEMQRATNLENASEDDEEPASDPREEKIERAYRRAVLGMAIPFLAPFAIYSFIELPIDLRPMSGRLRRKWFATIIFGIIGLLLFFLTARILIHGF
jgi:hypothetical protein